MRLILSLIIALFTFSTINAEILETINLKNGMVLKGYRSEEIPGGPFTFVSENTQFKLKDSDYDVIKKSHKDNKQFFTVILPDSCFAVKHGIDNPIELCLIEEGDNVAEFLYTTELEFKNLTAKDIALLEFTPYDENIVEELYLASGSKMEGIVTSYNPKTGEYSIIAENDMHWIPASKIKKRMLKRINEELPWETLMDRTSTIELNDKGQKRFKKNQLEGFFIGQNNTNGTLSLISHDGDSEYSIPFDCIAKKLTTPCTKKDKKNPYTSTKENEGLNGHNFFYASAAPNRYMCKVEDGNIVWEYQDSLSTTPIVDAVMLGNGDVLIACGNEIQEISQDGNINWTVSAPEGQEINIVRVSDNGKVGYVQSGDSLILTTRTNDRMENVTKLPCRKQSPNKGKQCGGFDFVGKNSYVYTNPESTSIFINDFNHNGSKQRLYINADEIEYLPNGNLLITTDNQEIMEIVLKGQRITWTYSLPDELKDKGIKIKRAHRLLNGNTAITLTYSESVFDSKNPPMQCIEVDKNGNTTWSLCTWQDPTNLGFPAVVQILE